MRDLAVFLFTSLAVFLVAFFLIGFSAAISALGGFFASVVFYMIVWELDHG